MSSHPLILRSCLFLALLLSSGCNSTYRELLQRAQHAAERGDFATEEQAPINSSLEEARNAFEEGQKLKEAGKHAEAVPLVEHALELRKPLLGESHPEVASCLDLLGAVHHALGNYTRAEPLLQRALAIREKAFGKFHLDVATSLSRLAAVYHEQYQAARAAPLYERALAIQEAALGTNHPSVAATLSNLATAYASQSLFARAELLLKRALAIQEAALGKDHPDVAASLHRQALIHHFQNRFALAEPLYERALAIRERALGKEHPDVAKTLMVLGTLYDNLGNYARAAPLLERALAIQESAFGKSHPRLFVTLTSLANNYYAQGLYSRAELLHKRALAMSEAAFGEANLAVSYPLLNLGALYMVQGDYVRAGPLLQRALAIREEALGKNDPGVAESLRDLAGLYERQGDYARARPLLERALAINETALGKDHLDTASMLNNLASLHAAQGLYAQAGLLHERGLVIREAALGKNHPLVAESLNNLANLYAAQGLYARAGPLVERALAIRKTGLGEKHPHVATSLNSLARIRVAQHRLAEALQLFEHAFTTSEAYLRQEVFGFSEARMAGLLHLLRQDEERLYALARVHPEDARVRHLALSAALLRKGRTVEEIADTSRIIYRSLGRADRETFERLRTLRTQLSALSLSGPGPSSPSDYQQRLKELAAQGDALEADLARRSAPLRALSALPAPNEVIDRVAKALPRNGALIEFVAYRDNPLVLRPGPPLHSPGQLRYLALLLFADGHTRAIDLGPAEPIDTAALRLHDALARRAVSYKPAAQVLYELAFRPLMLHLGQVQHLFLSPDGQLSLIPFAALHDGSRFLADALDITYLTSGKDLLRRREDFSLPRSVVVLADPEFGSHPTAPPAAPQATPVLAERSASLERFFSSLRSELADRPWPPLPGTRKEAEAIQRLLPQAQLLLGAAATKHSLLMLETPGILHVATHGFFLEDAAVPASSRAVKHFGATGDAGPQQLLPDPLLRSGLVLTGSRTPAAQPGSPRREDSLVTALELAGMDLWGTQLVVLSACDTGRGDVKLGQGVYGLRRALVMAGAETLVTSLWKVNDETTRELMERYYRNLLAGQGRAEALRAAMRALRQKHPHPYFWAPFIAIGRDEPVQGLIPPASAQDA